MNAHELAQLMSRPVARPGVRRWFVILRPATPRAMTITQKLRPIRSE